MVLLCQNDYFLGFSTLLTTFGSNRGPEQINTGSKALPFTTT